MAIRRWNAKFAVLHSRQEVFYRRACREGRKLLLLKPRRQDDG